MLFYRMQVILMEIIKNCMEFQRGRFDKTPNNIHLYFSLLNKNCNEVIQF